MTIIDNVRWLSSQEISQVFKGWNLQRAADRADHMRRVASKPIKGETDRIHITKAGKVKRLPYPLSFISPSNIS